MQQYQELIQTVLDTGSWQDNRTGIRTCLLYTSDAADE